VTEGTARKAQVDGFDIAGKTGTSQDYRDAWFVGYSAYYVGGVWVGNDDNSPTKTVTGGSIPALIWRDVMDVAHAGLSPEPLPGEFYQATEEPEPLVVSQDDTMQLPEEEMETPRRKQGFFERLFGTGDPNKPRRIIHNKDNP
jgi:penicillin-binding protein 1A